MKKNYEIDLTEGSLFKKILAFTIPVVLSGILQLTFNAADLIVVGRCVSDDALAAVGSNTPLISLIVNLLMGLATGTGVLVSTYYGAKDAKALRQTIDTTVIISIIGGVLFGLLGLFISEPMLRLLSTPESVLPLAALYLRIYFCGLPVIMLYNFCSAVLRSAGDTRRPLYYLAIAGVLNVGMNVFFVVVFNMGVSGVALATVLSQCVSCFLTVRCLTKSRTMVNLNIGKMKFSRIQFGNILRIGVPAGIQSSLFAISNVLIQSSVNSFGAVIMAGNSAGTSIDSYMFVAADGIQQAAVAAVGQNMGARDYKRTEKSVAVCTLLQFGAGIFLGAVIFLLRRPLVSIYTSDSAAIDAGAVRLTMMCAAFAINGMQHMMGGIMRGHGYSILPTVVSLIGICGLRVFWIYTIFAAHHELLILYMVFPVSWVLTAIAQSAFYFALRKKAYAANDAKY